MFDGLAIISEFAGYLLVSGVVSRGRSVEFRHNGGIWLEMFVFVRLCITYLSALGSSRRVFPNQSSGGFEIMLSLFPDL